MTQVPPPKPGSKAERWPRFGDEAREWVSRARACHEQTQVKVHKVRAKKGGPCS